MNAQLKPITTKTVNELPVNAIMPDPNQPRKIFETEELSDLAADIKAHGIIQPIVVRTDDNNQTMIICGERRWKAAQLAGLTTVPTITTDLALNELDMLIYQVSENLQRDNLKPLEMARFFNELNTTHNVKMKDIPTVLLTRGLKSMERSYISNMRRLLDLPVWAQDMINDGILTASHGKTILQAKEQEQIMADLHTKIDTDIEYEKCAPTTSELEDMVIETYNDHYRDLNYRFSDNKPAFNLVSCMNCETSKIFKHRQNLTKHFCFNEICFNEKQEKAKAARAAELDKRKKQQDEEWKLAEKEHKEQISNGDSTIPAPVKPQSDAQQALKNGRIERTQQYLDSWLREQLKAHLNTDHNTRYAVLLWTAAGTPGNYADNGTGGVSNPPLDWSIRDLGISLTINHHLDHDELQANIVNVTVKTMNRKNLRTLAHHCGIQLDNGYIVDEEYLKIKTKQELIDSTPQAVSDDFEDWDKFINKPAGEIIIRLINRDSQYGIPEDLLEMYAESLPSVSQETDNE